jgi:hypothetical protein
MLSTSWRTGGLAAEDADQGGTGSNDKRTAPYEFEPCPQGLICSVNCG